MNIVLEGENLTKKFGQEAIFSNISIKVAQGVTISIIGNSGGGKTTLLSILGLLQNPSCGKIVIHGQELTGASPGRLASVRQEKIGFVFQRANLIGNLDALDNVLVPAFFTGKQKTLKKKARGLLEEFGLGHRLRHYPWELSLGQMRLIALARAVLLDPSIILADEPTNDLDPALSERITSWLLEKKKNGTAIIIVTHDLSVARRADQTFCLKDGGLVLA